jgi:hypothetical protein
VKQESGEETRIGSEKEFLHGSWHFVVLRVTECRDKNTDFDMFIDGKFDSEGSLYSYCTPENIGITCGKFKRIKGMQGSLGDFLLYAYPLPDAEILEFYWAGKESFMNGGF